MIMNIQRDFILRQAAEGKRIDGRSLDQFRKIEIEKNPIEKAEGSARVKIGDTDVLVGIKLGIGTPFPDKPDEGILIVSAELSPIAYPKFEMGPPRELAIELARVVDRGIRESGTIDMKKLCITPGEKVWSVFVDIQILNHGGNLIDAYSLAALIALKNTKMPTLNDDETINHEKRETPLPINTSPLAVTTFKLLDGALIVDPTLEEEDASSARLTVTTKEDGNVTALQKSGDPLSVEEVSSAIDISLKKGAELRKLI